MAYIIENATVYKQDRWEQTSFLVEGGKILMVRPAFEKYRYMKMNVRDFVMAPTHVFYCRELPPIRDPNFQKKFLIQRFLLKGATTALISGKVESFEEIRPKMMDIRSFFRETAIDFVVSVRLRLELLSVRLIRQLKREKIPALFLEFADRKELYKIPWGWIREALFPYNLPFIPVPLEGGEKGFQLVAEWNRVLEREKIPHLSSPLPEENPISLEARKKIGIYPHKGYLQTGGELSYNLYLKEEWPDPEDLPAPRVTVHKGDVVRAGKKVFYDPRKGEELVINRPSFFH